MDFYFTDRKFNLLGVASTDGSTDISLANEEDKLSIEDSVRTLTGSLFYGPESRKQVEAMSALGNYVLYKDESGRSVWTTIMEINNDPLAGECVFLAEDAGVDLINELVGPYTADKAYPIASYISRFTYDSGFSIGINEISNLSRKLEWESDESTALARILSVATQFDNAELEFRFEVNGLEVVERYIDIFKKRGKDERVTLYVDKDINRITTSGNLYELGTSLYGIGGTPEGKDNPITLKGYKYTDKTGRYVLGSDGIMRDTVAVQKWSRLLSNDNPAPKSSHIQRRKTYETTDQKTLCDGVLRDLKKMAEVELNYEAEIVSLPYGVKIGDTIYLVDEQGELYLSARVLELVRCYSEDRYLATLGNYLIKDSGVDVNLQELADKLKDQIKPGDTYYPWTRYADDANGTGMSSVPDGKTYMATTHRKNDPIPSDDPADYAGLWVKIKGDPGTSPIITPNDDGTITIVDEEGTKVTPDLTGPQGDQGVGVDSENTKTDYQLHTSATVPPTGTWLTTPPAVTVGKYLWTRTILVFTDGTESTPAYSVSGGPGADGENGDDALPIFSGYVTNEAIILSATNSGAVSDFSKATGSFVTYLGQDQLTSGVTYSRVSQSGVTATINTTTGAYSVTAASADTGMVVFKAVYQGIEIQKIVSVTKAKQGAVGDTGPKGTDGKDGANGVKGDPGTNGVSSYLHTAWKMADGTFSTSYPKFGLLTSDQIKKYNTSTTNVLDKSSFDETGRLTFSRNASTNGGFYINDLTNALPNTAYVEEFTIKITSGDVTEFLVFSQFTDMPIFEVAINGTTVTRTIQSSGAIQYPFVNGTEYRFKISFTTGPMTTIPSYYGYLLQLNKTIATAYAFDMWDVALYTADRELTYPKYRGEYTDTIEADSTDPNRYTWTAYLGEQGPPTGVISQSTVPSSLYVGMLWQCTGNIAGYINPATYRWNGSAWEIYQFTAQNILADTFTGFVFRGVEFIGSKFVSEFRYPIGDGQYYYADGTTTIDNGGIVTDLVEHYPTDPEEYDESFSRHIELSPENALYMKLQGLRSDLSQEIQLSPGGLMLKTNELMATLTVENIYSLVNPASYTQSIGKSGTINSGTLRYKRFGNLVTVSVVVDLNADTGWIGLATPRAGYKPQNNTDASVVLGSTSYRGAFCTVYTNAQGYRLVPATGTTGTFQGTLTYITGDPFPYGDS